MFEWEDREYVNPRKKVFKNMDTDEILNLELQDDTDNILKESETPLNAHNLNLAQQELVDDMSKTYTGTNITAETVAGYGRINKVWGHTEETGTGEKSPDNPYKLECVGDDVNLFDSSIIQTNIATHKGDGTIVLNGTLTSNYVFSIILGAGVYTFYEPTGTLHTLISNDTLFKNVKKTTIAEEKKFNNYIPAGTYTNKIIKIKIQKYIEDREIKYSPYKYATVETISENDSNISSNIAYINKPLCCLKDSEGNIIARDYIDYTNKKIHRECAYIAFDGSENIQQVSNNNGLYRYDCHIADLKQNTEAVSSHFKYSTASIENINNECMLIHTQNKIMIFLSKISTVEQFKKWLYSNNVKAIYKLGTPVEEDIECSNKIVQYAEETTVYNSDGAEIEVCLTNNKAISEVNEDLNNIEKSTNNIEEMRQIKVISKEEFFSDINVNIVEFYAYKQNNIVNIQRMVVDSTSYTASVNKKIGTIKNKYIPASSKSIRLLASSGGPAIDFVSFIDPDGSIVVVSSSTKTSAIYIFNTAYISK